MATYANGDVYEGLFKAGKRQGEGTMKYASGQEATGNWENGALQQQETGEVHGRRQGNPVEALVIGGLAPPTLQQSSELVD